jgi:two-component system chemotaxis response regulator CheB
MPGGFTRALADGLNEISKVEVREAVEGELLQPNRVLIAPGGQQMKLAFEESRYLISIVDDPGFKGFKPSVDYLFESIASLPIAKYTSAAILTGMGSDGARGMGKLRREGAFTIAQDEETSIVFGMPKEAIELGAVVEVLPLTQISARLLERL